MDEIIKNYLSHYNQKFAQYGERPEGVDWGPDASDLQLRLERVLAVIETGVAGHHPPRILDVGCGYGSTLDYLNKKNVKVDFTGVDLCQSMIAAARSRHPESNWHAEDIFEWKDENKFDYVVCNGLVNLKLDASLQTIKDMARRLLHKMYSLSRIGCSINFMTTSVNYFAPHLFYQNPVEILGWCITELTSKFRLDHSYSLYEFTLHLYHKDAHGLPFGSHRDGTKEPTKTNDSET